MENVMVPKEELIERVAKALCRYAYPARTIEEAVAPDRELWQRMICESTIAVETMLAASPEQEPVGAGDLDFIGAQFGLKFTDGCDNGCAEIYSEDDDNWFLQIRCDRIWLGDLTDILQKAGVVGRLAHPSPPADKQAAQEGETPRTDAETIALLTEKLNHAVSLLMYAATSEDFDGDDCMQVANQIQSELVSMGKTSDWHQLSHWYDRFASAMNVSNEDEIDIYMMVETRLRELSTTPNEIFEKCARIAMCDKKCGQDDCPFCDIAKAIRAEALKVSAGGR